MLKMCFYANLCFVYFLFGRVGKTSLMNQYRPKSRSCIYFSSNSGFIFCRFGNSLCFRILGMWIVSLVISTRPQLEPIFWPRKFSLKIGCSRCRWEISEHSCGFIIWRMLLNKSQNPCYAMNIWTIIIGTLNSVVWLVWCC